MTYKTLVASLLAMGLMMPFPQLSIAYSEEVSSIADKSEVDPKANIPALEQRMERISDQLAEVRRDQLSYQIEKDLLKEIYSSNLRTVNTVITLILGLFTILAFFGIKSVGAIKQDFARELEHLRELRFKSEQRLVEIETQQNQAREKLDELTSVNSKQDQRLKLLEIQESAAARIRNKQFNHALEYIAVGLDIDPTNSTLRGYREHCLLTMNRFDDAIEAMEEAIEVDPDNESSALNLCEILLLQGRRERFQEVSARYAEAIQKKPHLQWLFDAITFYQEKHDERLKAHIEELLSSLPQDRKKKHMGWRFDEFEVIIANEEEREITKPLLQSLRVLNGEASPNSVFSGDNAEEERADEFEDGAA